MEQHLHKLIEEEIRLRLAVTMARHFEIISARYDIPMALLIKCTENVDMSGLCKGVNKSNKRCMKDIKECGFCGFHLHQMRTAKPAVAPPAAPVAVLAWENIQPSRLAD